MKRQAGDKLTLPVDTSVGESVNLEIGGRMKAAREALGLTQEQLAAKIGGSKRGIQDNEARKRVPGADVIAGFVRLGVNANWLLTGDGEMLLIVDEAHPAKASEADFAKINRGALAALLRGAIAITAQGMSADAAADMAAEMYEKALRSGEITPDGIGDGSLDQAA